LHDDVVRGKGGGSTAVRDWYIESEKKKKKSADTNQAYVKGTGIREDDEGGGEGDMSLNLYQECTRRILALTESVLLEILERRRQKPEPTEGPSLGGKAGGTTAGISEKKKKGGGRSARLNRS